MIRIVKQGHAYYGIEIESVAADEENIQAFIDSAEAVLIVSSLDDVDQFGLEPDEIQMIDPS